MKHLHSFFLALAMLGMITSCNDDNEVGGGSTPSPTPTPSISISDPNAVTEAVVIAGATLKTGTLPAPSNNGVLVLEALEEPLVGITKFRISVPVMERENDNIAGAYLQIKGSDQYFDIPLNSLEGGRLAQTAGRGLDSKKDLLRQLNAENLAINIELPGDLAPGEFCVDVSTYDEDGNVSNFIEACIIVQAFGGEGSEFLTAHEWEVVHLKIVGENDFILEGGVWETREESYNCASNIPGGMVTMLSMEEVYFAFKEDGSCEESGIVTHKYPEADKIEGCGFPDDEFIAKFTSTYFGGWSYSFEAQKLVTLFIEIESILEEEEQVVSSSKDSSICFFIEYDVIREGEFLLLHHESSNGFVFEYKLKQKQ